MYPDSGFAHPQPSFVTPVPLTGVDIDADPVVYLKVNRVWIPYLAGAMKQLVLQSTWDTTDPDALWLQQERVMMIFSNFAQALDHPLQVCEDAVSPGIFLEDTVSSQIRISPDDACIIQMWCIDHWEDWYDPRECIATGSGQARSHDGGQPAPGSTQQYCQTIPANLGYLYPVQVNAGDVITAGGMSGEWTDGVGGLFSAWYCPDGNGYVLGGCGGSSHLDGTDPLPTSNHMSLLAFIDGVYYPLASGVPFSVPAGVANKDMLLVPNTADMSIARGSVSACVTIQAVGELPVSATYAAGTGPTQITNGGTYLFTSDSSGNPAINVTFGSAVKITVISSTLDHPICATTCGYYTYYDPPGTPTITYSYPPTHPIDVPPTTNIRQWTVNSGGGGPTYTITVKIEF